MMSKVKWTTEGPDWMKELHNNPFNSPRKPKKKQGQKNLLDLIWIVGIAVGLGALLAMCS